MVADAEQCGTADPVVWKLMILTEGFQKLLEWINEMKAGICIRHLLYLPASAFGDWAGSPQVRKARRVALRNSAADT